jgi:hypothetical protein
MHRFRVATFLALLSAGATGEGYAGGGAGAGGLAEKLAPPQLV